MKIGIDARSILKKKKRTGIGYYTLNLITYLAKVDTAGQYYLYSYIRPFDFKRSLPDLPGPNFHHRLDRLKFAPDIKMKDMDVFHSSSYDMPKPGSAKTVSAIHDIIPLVHPENHTQETLGKLKANVQRVLDESDLVVANSENTKKDLEKVFSSIKREIKVVYPGRDELLSPLEDKKKVHDYLKNKYAIEKEFILFVGTIEKRKNVTGLISAFSDLKKEKNMPHLLVIAGMKGWGAEEAFELAENSEVKNEIRFAGYIPREDMIQFYNGADLFVYPSLYEGFGFPILESFSCGTPTVTSSNTSCGEIAGEAAIVIDPSDIGALKSAIDNILSDDTLKEELREKGLARARLFSWEEAAKQFKDIFYELV